MSLTESKQLNTTVSDAQVRGSVSEILKGFQDTANNFYQEWQSSYAGQYQGGSSSSSQQIDSSFSNFDCGTLILEDDNQIDESLQLLTEKDKANQANKNKKKMSEKLDQWIRELKRKYPLVDQSVFINVLFQEFVLLSISSKPRAGTQDFQVDFVKFLLTQEGVDPNQYFSELRNDESQADVQEKYPLLYLVLSRLSRTETKESIQTFSIKSESGSIVVQNGLDCQDIIRCLFKADARVSDGRPSNEYTKLRELGFDTLAKEFFDNNKEKNSNNDDLEQQYEMQRKQRQPQQPEPEEQVLLGEKEETEEDSLIQSPKTDENRQASYSEATVSETLCCIAQMLNPCNAVVALHSLITCIGDAVFCQAPTQVFNFFSSICGSDENVEDRQEKGKVTFELTAVGSENDSPQKQVGESSVAARHGEAKPRPRSPR